MELEPIDLYKEWRRPLNLPDPQGANFPEVEFTDSGILTYSYRNEFYSYSVASAYGIVSGQSYATPPFTSIQRTINIEAGWKIKSEETTSGYVDGNRTGASYNNIYSLFDANGRKILLIGKITESSSFTPPQPGDEYYVYVFYFVTSITAAIPLWSFEVTPPSEPPGYLIHPPPPRSPPDPPPPCDIPITVDPQFRDTGHFCMSHSEYNTLMTRFPQTNQRINTTNNLLRESL